MKSKAAQRAWGIFVHVILIALSFLCLFFFYILIVNATRSHAELQRGFSALPGKYFLENLKNVANDGTFPMFQGIINSLVVSACSADRKSTRLNSSHVSISYAVFCLKK